jgi:hypothetical protein
LPQVSELSFCCSVQEDNNPGTYPLQSERFYSALKGHGGRVRLVLLPHEGHGYRARESVLHTLYEQVSSVDMRGTGAVAV